MLSLEQAETKLKAAVPNGKVETSVVYNNLYLFQVFMDNPEEGQYDPFYSVDINSGVVNEFSVLTDGDFAEISKLFIAAKKGR